jgi:four helix bundle protein
MRILDALVEMVALVHGLAGKVARQDRDLSQQMKRASTSAALNASEGLWAKAGKRRSRLEDAVNSARETLMALRVAAACGYLGQEEAGVAIEQLDNIVPVLWVLAYRR